jgi:hypothetical protein
VPAIERPLIWATVLLTATYVLGSLLIQPSLFPDASYGLLVQKSMDHGAPWNHIIEPRGDDIAADRVYFYTIWSPGQYAVPAALSALGLKLGDAIKALSVVASLTGLIGWFAFFRVLAFERVIAAGACALIAASRSFGFSFVTYVGSDLLLFAAFPYFAMLLYWLRGSAWLAVAGPLLVVAGFFLKNSMAIYVLSWIAAVVVVSWIVSRPWSRRNLALTAISLGFTGLVVVLINRGYVARGWTPVTYTPVWAIDAAAYLLPSSMPLLAGTGLDDVLSRLFSHPSGPAIDYRRSMVVLGASLVATAWICVNALAQPRREIAATLLVFIGGVVAVFTYLLATGSGASVYLSRHYLVLGYALLPVMLAGVSRLRVPLVRYGVVACLVVPAV